MLVWVVIAAKNESNGKFFDLSLSAVIKNKTRDWTETCSAPLSWIFKIYEDHSVVSRFPLKSNIVEMESGDEIEVSIVADNLIEVKKCGIHLLVNEPDVLVEYGSIVQHVDSDTASASVGTMVCVKRRRNDNEAGSSGDNEAGSSDDWPIEEKSPKRSRMESEAQG